MSFVISLILVKEETEEKKTQAALENSLNSKKYYNYNHNISKFIFIFGVWISLHHYDKFKLSLHSRWHKPCPNISLKNCFVYFKFCRYLILLQIYIKWLSPWFVFFSNMLVSINYRLILFPGLSETKMMNRAKASQPFLRFLKPSV